MKKLNKNERDTLKEIYQELETKDEICVSSPKFKKTLIDYLINQGLLEKEDASTLNGWAYILKPTYEGEMIFEEILNSSISKVEAFIKQGEVIMKEECHHVTEPGLIMPDYISGPKSDQWFSEISIFNSRVLEKHPLHKEIDDICKNHHTFSSHDKMMGYLRALVSDVDFWREQDLIERKESFPYQETNLSIIPSSNADKIEKNMMSLFHMQTLIRMTMLIS